MTAHPVRRFNLWLEQARNAGVPLAETCALATADRHGRPSVRFVLLKSADPSGFVFYTNGESRKGREMADNPRASLAFYWDATGKQFRVDGSVGEVSAEEADAYWSERPRESQLASAASRQSRPLELRRQLLARVRKLTSMYEGRDVPRPPHWIGYRLTPGRMEFWTRREPRLHVRELFVLRKGVWHKQLLQP